MIMETSALPTEIILSHPQRSLGKLHLDSNPEPGSHLEIAGKTYTVLERRHCYQFRAGKYRLQNISLYVQSASHPLERSLVDGHWVLGDATCSYNAASALIRCAVNPDGPCASCRFYEKS